MSEMDDIRYLLALQTAKNKIEASAFRRQKMFIAVEALIEIGHKQGRVALLDTLKDINNLIAEDIGP